MPSVLILGAGLYQVPAIVKARRMGLRTVACSYLPDDPGLALADTAYTVSTTDKEAVLSVAKRERVDGVTTGASDVAVSTVGYVNDALGLRGLTLAQARTFSRKDLFRAFLKANGLPHPEFHVFDEVAPFIEACAGLSGRYIAKPVDSSGSKGVHELRLPSTDTGALEAIFAAAKKSSMRGRIILEGFIEGVEHGGDAFFRDGELVTLSVTEKQLNGPPHYVPVGHMIPGDLPPEAMALVVDALRDTVSLIGLRDGVVNFDVMVDDSGVARILEMSPRYGGNCIPTIIEYGTGFDEIGANLAVAVGESSESFTRAIRERTDYTASRILGAAASGVVSRIPDAESLMRKHEGILREMVWDVAVGDPVSRFVSGNLRVGHFIATEESLEALARIVRRIESEATLGVVPGPPDKE